VPSLKSYRRRTPWTTQLAKKKQQRFLKLADDWPAALPCVGRGLNSKILKSSSAQHQKVFILFQNRLKSPEFPEGKNELFGSHAFLYTPSGGLSDSFTS